QTEAGEVRTGRQRKAALDEQHEQYGERELEYLAAEVRRLRRPAAGEVHEVQPGHERREQQREHQERDPHRYRKWPVGLSRGGAHAVAPPRPRHGPPPRVTRSPARAAAPGRAASSPPRWPWR